jgi:hypothetical protein
MAFAGPYRTDVPQVGLSPLESELYKWRIFVRSYKSIINNRSEDRASYQQQVCGSDRQVAGSHKPISPDGQGGESVEE